MAPTDLIDALSKHSLPLLLLAATIAIVVWLLRMVIESSVESAFENLKKEQEKLIERRSDFRQKIWLDRYNLVTGLHAKIGECATYVNRRFKKFPVPDGVFVVSEQPGAEPTEEILPLTEAFELLATNRAVVSEKFFRILEAEAQIVIQFALAARSGNAGEVAAALGSFGREVQKFDSLLNEHFQLDSINPYSTS